MFNKSKKFLSLMLCVLMCISMLTAIVLPASAAGESESGSDPYAAIKAIQNSDGTYTPTKGVFVFAGAPASGSVTYTYGDGKTWGDGKTYKLVGGETAFSLMNDAIHHVEAQWNAYTGAYSAYTGPDTVVVAPGTYGGNSWQNNKQITMNLPRDKDGNTIENPAYYELFTYTVLGPQAGKDPTPTAKADIANGTLNNGRSTNNKTEAVSTSTMWMPRNAQIIVDGFAFRGTHNFHGSAPKVSLIMKNIVHKYDDIYSNGLYRWNDPTYNVNLEFHNYAMEYTQISNGTKKDNLENFNMNVTRLVFDNYYEYGGNLKYVSDKYNQAHMINYYPTTTANIAENFLGPDNKTASFTMVNSTLSHNRTAHWIRTRMNDNADAPTRVYSTNGKNSVKFVVKDNYFYNAGDAVGTDVDSLGNPAADPANIIDVFSFQDKWSLPAGALEFAFEGNTVEYTADCLTRHTSGSLNGLINIKTTYKKVDGQTVLDEENTNNVNKQNFWFKNNTMILPTHASEDAISLSESDQALDRSSILVLNPQGEVVAMPMKDNQDKINDVYAGDDFQGGIAEMFTVKTATDMAFNCNVNSVLRNSRSPAPVTADLYIVPYAAEKTHAAKDLFTFRGDKVEFVNLTDKNGQEMTEAKPSELDGAKMVATYKGKTTTCKVTFNIKVATEEQMVFVDANNSATSYTFNGKTYALSPSNCVGSFKDAVAKNKLFWVVLPGSHTFAGGNTDRIYDTRVTILGPKMGVSPLDENNDLDFSNRAITGTAAPYTIDTTQEALLNGQIVVYGSQGRLMMDGVVLGSTFHFSPSDAAESWGLATGSAIVGVDTNNVVVNDLYNGNFVDGLSSGAALLDSKVKRYFNANNTAFCNVAGGCIVSSGLYDINFDHIYAAGGTGEMIRTRMPSGNLMDMSPMECGLSITNSKIENWGTTGGHWIYTNYADYTTDSSWGLSANCTGANFPAGVHQIFENNTFINIGKSGCQTKGYALRLGIPREMDNAKIIFRNNTVMEDTLSTYRFIDTFGSAGNYLAEGNVDISGNAFINFTEPVRLGQADTTKATTFSLNENYFATIVDGEEVATPITADTNYYVSVTDEWYYIDRNCEAKNTDFALSFNPNRSNKFEFNGDPEWTAEVNLTCGSPLFDATDFIKSGNADIVGVYADVACTNALTTDISADTVYVKLKVGSVEKVVTTIKRKTDHSFGEYVITTDPGCETEGTETRTCSECGFFEDRSVASLGHDNGEFVVVQRPWCEQEGIERSVCSRCGGFVDRPIAALVHVPSEQSSFVAATCTTPAREFYPCEICGAETSVKTFEGSELGHDWGEWETVNSGSCTVDAVAQRVCKRSDCDAVDTDTTPAPGHTWGDWAVTIEPSCETEGTQIRECSVCNAFETLAVTATGHDYQAVTTDPTCVSEGKVEQVCGTCGQVDETRTEVLPATGVHDWGNYIEMEATCVQQGVTERFCKVCGVVDEETREVSDPDYTNHNYDPEEKDWTVIEEGDCLNPAVSERSCLDCGSVDTSWDYTNVTGYHAYVLKTSPASYDQSGKYEKYCPDCGDTQLMSIIARLPRFTDVDSKAWYADTLTKAAAMGLLKGYEDGTVRPNNYITRAEAVSMVARLAGVNTSAYSTKKFVDVAAKAWYNGAIAWAEQNMIVSGRSENTFDPNGNISRQELCAILTRYTTFAKIELNMELAKSKFADDAKIAQYAKESVYLCQRAGLVSGRPGNLFAPTAYATRAEVARILVLFAEEYGQAQTDSALAKSVAISVENDRHASVVDPLEEQIAECQAELDDLLAAAAIDVADLKDATFYEDELVAKEYALYDLLLEIRQLPDGAEKTQKQAQADTLSEEITVLQNLYDAAIYAADIADLQEELTAENELHEENLAAINAK